MLEINSNGKWDKVLISHSPGSARVLLYVLKEPTKYDTLL